MVQHRFRHFKIGVLSIVCFLLLISIPVRGEGNSAWLQYKQAAMLFKQNAQLSEITHLLKGVQNTTLDSVQEHVFNMDDDPAQRRRPQPP